MANNNGLEKIKSKIIAEAMEYERQALTEAGGDIAKIEEKYKKRAAEINKDIIDRAQREAQRRISGAESGSALVKRNELLSLKVELIDKAFALAKSNILSMDKSDYTALFTEILVKAANENLKNGGSAKLRLSKKDKDISEELISLSKKGDMKLRDDISISVDTEYAEIDGGFILVLGNVEINCSVSTLIHSLKADRVSKVSEILFSDRK